MIKRGRLRKMPAPASAPTRFFAPGNRNQQRRPTAPPLITKFRLFQAIWTLSYTPCAPLQTAFLSPRVRNPEKSAIKSEFVSTVWPNKGSAFTVMISAVMLSPLPCPMSFARSSPPCFSHKSCLGDNNRTLQ